MAKPEETLKETLEKVAKENNYEISQIVLKAISSEGANYTSFLYNATLQSRDKEDLEIFAKVAAVGENVRASAPVQMYETESFFYNKLLNKYKLLEEKHNILAEDRYKAPKFYGGSDVYSKETVILENLTTKGYKTYNRFKSIDWEYASKSLEALAKFHALSIALSEDDPEGFEEVYALNNSRNFNAMLSYLETVVKNSLQVIREENRDRVSKYADELMKKKDLDRFFQHHRRRVIIHGDYRPSNMLHRVINGKVELVVVDYQTLRIGNPLIDIVYFIFIGSDKNFRDKYFKASLEHYYEELCKALGRFGLNPKELYSREDFDFELKEVLPVGLLLSIFLLLIVTVEKEEAPEVKQDLSFDDFAINPNNLYTERLNDIVDDYIKMGII